MSEPLPTIRGVTVPCLVLAVLAGAWLLTPHGPAGRAGAAVAATPPVAGRPVVRDGVLFNRDIRPILADRCFSCHGPDANKRQAGLRLDRPDAATGPLPLHKDRRAFVPGDPDHSEAVRRMLTTDPALVMPPATSHLKLDEAEKDRIRKWVAQGGEYQEHWAFVAPVRPAIPAVSDPAWPKNDVDRFVLANLDANGLKPTAEADRPTLIRRASLDLTGLPPTPAEVDAFVADKSPDAYEKVVDRLLASPRYGEQMAVNWLDYARYADSHGFQSDPERHMWRWRDWVIDAYNSDMPFDQFAIQQIAGDLLPNATVDQRVATGFNRNNRFNDEGGIIEEEWRVESVIDRADTTSAVFLGLTMECCRCHDHKYDPITQKEFYRFSAYFNSVNEKGADTASRQDRGVNAAPVLKVPTAEQTAAIAAATTRVEQDGRTVDALQRTVAGKVAGLGRDASVLAEPAGLVVRLPLDGSGPTTAPATGPTTGPTVAGVVAYTLENQPKPVAAPYGKGLTFGHGSSANAGDVANFDRTDKFSYGAWVRRRNDGGGIVTRMTVGQGDRGFDLFVQDDRLCAHFINSWPDNALKAMTRPDAPKGRWMHVFVTYDGTGKLAGVRMYVDGHDKPLEAERDALTGPIASPTSPLRVGMRTGGDEFDGDIADVRIYGRVLSPAEVAVLAGGPGLADAAAKPGGQRSKAETDRLTTFVETTDPAFAKAATTLGEDRRALAMAAATVGDTMVMEELPKPRPTYVLNRGEYDKHGEQVQPGTPAVLPPLPTDAPPNRLGLARWIVDPANPLTSRVQANRLWERLFGVGLVKTSENLGVQTEWPSDPELLDYLATEYVRLHWDTKALLREMVVSAAYRQATTVTPELLERDPENRLVARGPRFRLSAEQIRDQALAVSGLLVEKVGGPSVLPYAPANLWAGNMYGNLAKYNQAKDDGLYRRSLYTFVKRTAPPSNLSTFDQPTREYCVIRRSRTDTPLQALDLMDDPQYVECARVLAEHMMAAGTTPEQRLAWGFKRAVCREPTAGELSVLVDGYRKQLERYRDDPAAAADLVAVGAKPVDMKIDHTDLAAYATTASVILNLDEVVTKP